jgi:hypothetical protein
MFLLGYRGEVRTTGPKERHNIVSKGSGSQEGQDGDG